MKTFYLFRHALAVLPGQVYGDRIFSAEILPEGIPAIKKLAEYLITIPTDYNVSSEILRCKQTAHIISETTNKNFVFDVRLNELHQESAEEFIKRVKSFLDEVNSSQYESILICTHGAVIAALKHLITEDSIEESDLFDYSNPGELLTLQDKTISLKNFNG